MTDADGGTFRHQLRVEASPESVFFHFTDPALMSHWMGIDHKLDPEPGGVFMVDINGRDVVLGEFVEVDPPHRVVFTWGWQESAEVPPGSTTVEVNLTPDGNATVIDFVHRGLPPGQLDAHAQGWAHFLPRLGIAGAGGDPAPDSFQTATESRS
jgi:uncharacterized protein YndB with AHSA1/START domain